MALPLTKEKKTKLSINKPIDKIMVKLNWDPNGMDLDMMAIGKKNGQAPTEEDVLFWGTEQKNKKGQQHIGNQSAVFITGDNRTGEGEDDEVIEIRTMNSEYDEIELYVSVYPPDGPGGRTLDEALNAKIELYFKRGGEPEYYFNLNDDKYFGAEAIMAGTITINSNGHPEFQGSDEEFTDGLVEIFQKYNFETE